MEDLDLYAIRDHLIRLTRQAGEMLVSAVPSKSTTASKKNSKSPDALHANDYLREDENSIENRVTEMPLSHGYCDRDRQID